MIKIFTAVFTGLVFLYTLNYKSESSYKEEVVYLKTKVSKNHYNSDYAIIIDYALNSSKRRFFVVDLNSEKIIKKFHVAHGSARGKNSSTPTVFSNINNSNASSLGLALVSERGYSRHGINKKYVLKGLDKTNSNMQLRNIVLHSSDWIIENNLNLFPITQSLGCPTVANSTMEYLDDFIQSQRNKKILMYIIVKNK